MTSRQGCAGNSGCLMGKEVRCDKKLEGEESASTKPASGN